MKYSSLIHESDEFLQKNQILERFLEEDSADIHYTTKQHPVSGKAYAYTLVESQTLLYLPTWAI